MKNCIIRGGPITAITVGALAVILPAVLITAYALKEVAISDSVGIKTTPDTTDLMPVPIYDHQAFLLGMSVPNRMPEYVEKFHLMKGVTGSIGRHESVIDKMVGVFGVQARACPPARACPKPVNKAGFDPTLVGCCFGAMLLVAWRQKRRAVFGHDMVMCVNTDTDVGGQVLPTPILFGRSASASARKKENFTPVVISLVAMTGNNGHDLGKESEIALSFGPSMGSREQKRDNRLYNLYIKAFMGEQGNQIGRHYLLNCLLHQLPHKAELIKKAFEDTELAA